jgi:hypothetical protein
MILFAWKIDSVVPFNQGACVVQADMTANSARNSVCFTLVCEAQMIQMT